MKGSILAVTLALVAAAPALAQGTAANPAIPRAAAKAAPPPVKSSSPAPMRANGPPPPMSGYIQVVIPRALTLHAIENGSQTSCMPVVAVRNETPETVEHITVEITYTGASGAIDHSSTVHDDIDRNEEDDRAVESLNIGPCAGATAKAYIRLCLFEDGEDCRNWVEGSEFGAIPLKGGMPRGMAGTEMHEK